MLTRKQVLRLMRDAPKLRKRLNDVTAKIEKLSQLLPVVRGQLAIADAVTHVIDGVPLIMSKPSATTVWIRPVRTEEGTGDRVMAELYRRTDGSWIVQARRRLTGEGLTQDAILPMATTSVRKAMAVAMRWVALGDLPKDCEYLIWR